VASRTVKRTPLVPKSNPRPQGGVREGEEEEEAVEKAKDREGSRERRRRRGRMACCVCGGGKVVRL
jgi:hypothetical protein